MILFGESLNVMSKKIGPAFKERNPEPIQEEVLRQRDLGMDYIDINLGPAKKDGIELMPWVVQTVQEVVDLPLLLDTSNMDAIEAGLKVARPVEKAHIIRILEKSKWKLSGKNGAAELLGLNPNTLYSRMKKLGIQK